MHRHTYVCVCACMYVHVHVCLLITVQTLNEYLRKDELDNKLRNYNVVKLFYCGIVSGKKLLIRVLIA